MVERDTGRILSVSRNVHGRDATGVAESGGPESGADGSPADRETSGDATALVSLQSELIKAVEDGDTHLASSIVRKCNIDEDRADLLSCALFHACKDRSLTRVETCLGLGADPNRPGTDGLTALASAVELDNAGLVEYLLGNEVSKADVHLYMMDGRSLLELVRSDSMEKILVSHGADFNDQDSNGRTGLMKTSCETVARRFLAGGCAVNATDDQGMTALLYSLKSRKPSGMFKLLVDAGADCTVVDKVRRSAWHYFAGCEKLHGSNKVPWTAADLKLISEQLNKAGADAKRMDKLGFTPLYCVSKTGDVDLMIALLRNGRFRKEDLNVVNEGGRTALHLAVGLGYREVAKFLLDHGADPNVQTSQGTPLHRAVQSKMPDMDMIELLLGRGADANITDYAGCNTLHRVCANSNASPAMVKAVFTKISDVNAEDSSEATALHLMAKYGHVESLRFLLGSNLVSRTVEDKDGNLPIFYAATRAENANDFLECFAPSRYTASKSADHALYPNSTVSILESSGLPTNDIFLEFPSPHFFFVYTSDTSLSAPREDLSFQWTHLPVAGPDVLQDMVITHFLARKRYIAVTAQEWEGVHLFLKMPKIPALLRRPQVVCRRNGIIESVDIGDVASDHELQMIIMAMPCFNSSMDIRCFTANSEGAATGVTELRDELLTPDNLWLCLLGDKYLISVFPHKTQQKHSGIELDFEGFDIPQTLNSPQQLVVWLTGMWGKNDLALSELMGYMDSCERRKEALSQRFERAVAETSRQSMRGTTRNITDELFDISDECVLALNLQHASKSVKAVRGVVTSQHAFVDAMIELERIKTFSEDVLRQFNATSRTFKAQVQKLDDLQASAAETNDALLVLLDLKQRQANSIEARSAREQSVLARHQNQTLLVFTIVTVIFLPLSFIAGLLAIDIMELPHNASGNQQLPLGFVLRYVLGPGLGCAALCILIAFSGFIKRASKRTNRWLLPSTGKQRVHDPETGDTGEKLKAN